ncbi:MAG: hypothetical protein HOW73_43135 [Polyangiaceae bacterium]|nr:hypothetical protein [Polyangiaceae bacterium]
MQIECPSGLVVEARKIKAQELEALAEANDSDEPPADGGLLTVINRCVQRVIDAGPYSFVEVGDALPDWKRVIYGDLATMFFKLRIVSVEDPYEFPVQCKHCRKWADFDVTLSELPINPLPESSKAKLRSNSPFEARTLDGKLVRFYLKTIRREEPIAKLVRAIERQTGKPSYSFLDSWAGQAEFIEPLGERSKNDKARWMWFRQLDLDEVDNLRDQFDAVDGGIDIELRFRCRRRGCGGVTNHMIPLDGDFFRRKRKPADLKPLHDGGRIIPLEEEALEKTEEVTKGETEESLDLE